MIRLKKTEAFIKRVWLLSEALPWLGRDEWDNLSNDLCRAPKTKLSLEQRELKLLYKGFQDEFEENMSSLIRSEYSAYFNELSRIFRIGPDGLRVLNETCQQLMLEQGMKFRDVAWAKMQERLSVRPSTYEVAMEAYRFYLIATDGASYYQAALAEIEQQRRLVSIIYHHSDSSIPPLPMPEPSTVSESIADKTNPIVRIRQIALRYVYEDWLLNPSMAIEVAASAGFISKTSGQQLMKHYNNLAHQTTNRIGVKGKALTDMIKDVSAVLPMLSEQAKARAERELQTLITKK